MATFPLTKSDLETYIAGLVNDPSMTRYTQTLIDNQLDLAQSRWNLEAKICRWTDYIALTANQYRYPIINGNAGLLFIPLQILRVTHKGIELAIRSIEYMDRYSANDWTTAQGTPQEICFDLNSYWNSDSSSDGVTSISPSFILHPTPQGNDVTLYTNNVGVTGQNPLKIEYLAPHSPLVNPSDTPFTINTYTNSLVTPYLAGLGLDAAASLLEPDPTKETVVKAKLFRAQANAYLSLVVQMYQGLEEEAPMRMAGGRNVRL